MNDPAHDYEASILLKLMEDSAAIPQCDLRPDEFDNDNYREIYRAIEAINLRGDVVDMLVVADYLNDSTGKNWGPLLVRIRKSLHAPSNISMHIGIVRKANEKRKAQSIAQKLIETAHITGAIDDAIRDLMDLSVPTSNHQYDINTGLKMAVDDIDENSSGKPRGISTGLTDLDEKLGGFHAPDLVVIGARPAMGKTALLVNMLLAAALDGVSCGFFSGEQDIIQIMQRTLAIQGRIPLVRMRNGKMQDEDWPKLSNAISKLKDRQVQIDDTGCPSLAHIARTARKWRYANNIGILFIDYLQRIETDKNKARFEAVGDNTRALKTLAKELGIPIVVLAQVNRDVEKRSDRRPNMGDLSDSSEIEKEADEVFMLYRDEVYNPDTNDKGIAEILIEKNRHGPTGYVKTAWFGQWLRFENLASKELNFHS